MEKPQVTGGVLFRRARERAGARGLVLLTAAPLLGVVAMLGADGGALAYGPAPVAHKRPQEDGGLPADAEQAPAAGKPEPTGKPKPPPNPKPRGNPETHAEPKAHPRKPGKPKHHGKHHGKHEHHAMPKKHHTKHHAKHQAKATPRKPAQPAAKPKAPSKKPVAAETGTVVLSTKGPGRLVVPGGIYNWPFAVTAQGQARPHRAVFRTTLPKTLRFVSGQTNCSSSGRRIVCRLGMVRPGQTVAGVLRAKVSRRAKADRMISPLGTVIWGAARVSAYFPPSIVARTADVAVTKSAPATARAGAAIPYETKVRNLGPFPAENVIVRSEGPMRLVEQDTACVPQDAGYVCAVGLLAPGEERTLHTTVVPGANARAGSVVESPSTATSSTADINPANNEAVARTRITPATDNPPAPPKRSAPSRGMALAGNGGAARTVVAHANGITAQDEAPAGVTPADDKPADAARQGKAAAESRFTASTIETVAEIAVAMAGTGFVLTRLTRRRRRTQD